MASSTEDGMRLEMADIRSCKQEEEKGRHL